MKNKNKSDEPTIQNYVNKESPLELPRRSLLKGAIAATATTFMSGFVSRDAMADSNSNDYKAGNLFKVKNVVGFRAGGAYPIEKSGESFRVNRHPFITEEAYTDPGYWFFCFKKDGLVAAVRTLTTAHSNTKVVVLMLGHYNSSELYLTSSLGKINFTGKGCRIIATNYYDADQVRASARNCSSYFLATQTLTPSRSNFIDQITKDQINSVIESEAEELKLDFRFLKYLK